MRQRRVGTLTMGVVLVLLGAVMIFSQIKGMIITSLILKGWPLILILLGGEVLWFSYIQKGENTKLFYDIFSIFIIGVICFTSIGIYSLNEMGLISRVNALVLNQSFMLNIEAKKCPIDESVKKIIVEAPRCDIKVRTGSENTIVAYGKAYIDAESKEKAKALLKAQDVIYRKHGDVLYVSFDIPVSGNIRIEEYNLIFPENLAVEIDSGSHLLKLQDVKIGANWEITSFGKVEVQLIENPDVKIAALVSDPEDLTGNANWQIKKVGVPKENSSRGYDEVRGEVTCGSGKYSINIISKGKVVLNRL